MDLLRSWPNAPRSPLCTLAFGSSNLHAVCLPQVVERSIAAETPAARCSASGASNATEQVPTVSLDIQEYGDLPVRLNTRGANERDTRGDHPRVRSFEIIDSQEKADPPGKLSTHDRLLMIAIGAREQNAGGTAYWAHNDPALGATIVRQRRDVLNQFELEDIYKEVDRRIVLPHNQRYQLEVRHPSVPATKR